MDDVVCRPTELGGKREEREEEQREEVEGRRIKGISFKNVSLVVSIGTLHFLSVHKEGTCMFQHLPSYLIGFL